MNQMDGNWSVDLAKSVFTAHNHVYVYSFFQALAKLPLILVDYRDIKRAGIHQSTLIKL